MRLGAISSSLRKPVAIALLLAFGLNGCENAGPEDWLGKGFLAQQETMRLTHNQIQLPILDKLSGLDEPNEEFALARNVQAEDLKVESADYIIGKNDLLSISLTEVVPGAETIKTTRVSESGFIVLPLIGQVQAAGYTEAKLDEAIVQKYKDSAIVKEAQVSVTVLEARQRTFQIRGAVARPGQYQIVQSDFRVLDALVLAGDTVVPNIEYLYVIRPPAKPQPTTQPVGQPGPVNPATTPVKPGPDNGGLLEPKPKVDKGLTPAEKTEPVPTTPKPDSLRTEAPKLNFLSPVNRTRPFGSRSTPANVSPDARPKPAMPNLDDLTPIQASKVQKSDAATSEKAAPEKSDSDKDGPEKKIDEKTKSSEPDDSAPSVPKLMELPTGADGEDSGKGKPEPKLDDLPAPPATLNDINKKPGDKPSDKPTTDKVGTDKPATDKPLTDKPAEKPAAEPLLDKPIDKPMDKPGIDKPGDEKPPIFINGGQPLEPRPEKTTDDMPGPDKTKEFEFNTPLPEDQSTIIKVPLRQLLFGDLKYNIVIKPQDTIMVPIPEAGEFYMAGHVARVGVYSLTGRNITLKQAIVSAGMLDEVAIPERTDVIRRVGRDREVFVRVNLVKVWEGKQPDFFLKPYDIVQVGTNAVAPFIAALRNGFRITYGLGFLYDRNFFVDSGTNGTNTTNGTNRRTR